MRLFIRKMPVFILIIAAAACFSVSASEDYVASLFQKANEAYENGLRLDDKERESELKIAVGNYEKIIRQAHIKNGYLYYNLGNAYFHLNELGKAIVNYRRAERFLPNFPDLRDNLRTAISKRQDRIEKTQIESIWRTLFFWHYIISQKGKMVLFSSFFILVWTFLYVRLYRNTLLVKWAVVLTIILSVAFGVSLGMGKYEQSRVKSGVIIAKEADAKKAPYANAESEFTKPLHEGTEFQVIEERSGWYRIMLDDGKNTWLPSESCEII